MVSPDPFRKFHVIYSYKVPTGEIVLIQSFKSIYCILFYSYECFDFIDSYAPHVCLLQIEARKGHQILWKWSYRWLWVTTWVPGNKPRSCTKAASVFIHWIISPALWILIIQRMCQIWLFLHIPSHMILKTLKHHEKPKRNCSSKVHTFKKETGIQGKLETFPKGRW